VMPEVAAGQTAGVVMTVPGGAIIVATVGVVVVIVIVVVVVVEDLPSPDAVKK
jgi:hypothetical protein